MLLGMCCRSMLDQVLMWSSVYQTRRQTSRTKVAGVRNMPASTCSVHGPWAVAAHRSRDDGELCAIARRFRHELLVHGLSFTRRGVGACRSRGGLHGKGGGGSTRLLPNPTQALRYLHLAADAAALVTRRAIVFRWSRGPDATSRRFPFVFTSPLFTGPPAESGAATDARKNDPLKGGIRYCFLF